MNLLKRQARAKRRAKTMRLIKNQRVPATCSKWSVNGTWRSDFTPGEWQSARKLARREEVL